MEKIYTVGNSKLIDDMNRLSENKVFGFTDVLVDGGWYNIYFGISETGKMYAVLVKTFILSHGVRYYNQKHGGNIYHDVFKRINFDTKEQGNNFYKLVKTTKKISKKGNEYYTLSELEVR